MTRSVSRVLLAVTALVSLAVVGLAGGCSSVDTSGVTADAAVPVSRTPLNAVADKKIVAIGEATHGNAEFADIRLELVQRLVVEQGYRTVALEADFGGAAAADDYIRSGGSHTTTAEEAARHLGFAVYSTTQTADLLRWLHDHNATVPAREQVHFYGFDMQRYDLNKERLQAYLNTVDPAAAATAHQSLVDLTDATRSTVDPERLRAGTVAAAQVVAQLRSHQTAYQRATSADAFTLALQHAETISRGAALQAGPDADFARDRDAGMAKNVQWIVAREAAQGRAQVVLAGHNSHLEKSGAAFAFDGMGKILARVYQDRYFVIGTDFAKSTFLARDGSSGQRKTFTVNNRSPLRAMAGLEPVSYLDLRTASTVPANRELLASKIRMGSAGDSYRSFYRFSKTTFTVSMVPLASYDAVVFVQSASPVTPL